MMNQQGTRGGCISRDPCKHAKGSYVAEADTDADADSKSIDCTHVDLALRLDPCMNAPASNAGRLSPGIKLRDPSSPLAAAANCTEHEQSRASAGPGLLRAAPLLATASPDLEIRRQPTGLFKRNVAGASFLDRRV